MKKQICSYNYNIDNKTRVFTMSPIERDAKLGCKEISGAALRIFSSSARWILVKSEAKLTR